MPMTPTTPLYHVLLFALVPSLTLIVGGVAALFWTPSAAWRSAILHFAAGVVFSVVAVELLPDIVKQHAPLEVALGFGTGVAVMLGIRVGTQKLTRSAPDPSQGALPLGLLAGIAVDVALDGLLLGIGFAAGTKEGTLLALALAGEILALGITTSTELRQQLLPRPRIVAVLAGIAMLFLLGAGLGATLLHGLRREWLELVLSFGLAALLFLVTEELLTEAHEEEEKPLLTLAFFGGFLLFLLLGMVM
jgi:ZIP family zinc transporter